MQQANSPVDFFTWLFFVFTTISLVGYGSPMQSTASLMVIMLCLPVFFVYLPEKSGELMRLYSMKSKYARDVYQANKSIPHIVLLGTVSQTALRNFLEELFNEDHFDTSGGGNQNIHCVLMQPGKPEAETLHMLVDPEYTGKLVYL